MHVKKKLAAIVCLVFPPIMPKNFLLRLLGWEIGKGCKIGFSWIECGKIILHDSVKIGHGNYLSCKALVLKDSSYLQHFNQIRGDVWVFLRTNAAIGNFNKIIRARRGVTWGRSVLRLGVFSKITSKHLVDCTRSVRLGNYTTIAGVASQIWTHGYLHAPAGLDRFRVDGSVKIGNNVYIGSACVINAGVTINNGITVGASSCVSKSLVKPGLYVSQALRWIESDYDAAKQRYPEVKVNGLVEAVFNKKPES
ncbi:MULTISPECIES: acyltransferase [unclassified Pseudomonas]|jgi:acetyltransferase-like isoleucine patch superfamily enzyme|uniref:acyltransferase n=1 Tax=unclassified Pseudomonas TaxID=196821 RepID=UPI00095384CB|nr:MULTISPECIES: hypothetical protein [unclassified Pseudomonas]MXR29641.1 hypothetical protein [Pseudomonas sp. PICF6]SIS11414.1 Acetyltransferase (isoleucine patch superfamily) [Pseudomonas sp. A214]